MKNIFKSIAGLMTVIGALNWGLIGLFGFNAVSRIFGASPMIEKWIYIIIGISGLVVVAFEAAEPKM